MSSDVPRAEREPRPWPKKSSERGDNLLVCRVRFDHMQNPRTGETLRRVVLETRDWVNVIALTEDERVVVVRQFRFGSATITTEIPGGVIDRDEAPIDAARRELREECGYTAEHWTYLGAVQPNPAFHDNLCHHFLARDAKRTHPQEQDEGEDIQVDEIPLEEIRRKIRSGEIQHALVLTAFQRVLDLRSSGD